MTTPLVDLVQEAPAEARRQQAAIRALAVVSVLLLLFGLVGLVTVESDDPGPPEGTPLAIVFSAADKTLGQSARISMNTEMSFGDKPGPAITAEGVADFAEKKVLLTMKAAGLFELEMRSDGKTVFVKVPEAMGNTPPGKPWVAIDMSVADKAAAESPMSGLPGASGPMSGTDPGEMLEWLRSHEAVKDAVAVGRVTIRGASTTQYRVTVDFAALAKAMDAPDEALGEMEGADFVIDLYVDDDGLIRRETLRIGSNPTGGFAVSAVSTIDFSDFGLDVDVDPPPANQVVKAESLEEFQEMFDGGN